MEEYKSYKYVFVEPGKPAEIRVTDVDSLIKMLIGENKQDLGIFTYKDSIILYNTCAGTDWLYDYPMNRFLDLDNKILVINGSFAVIGKDGDNYSDLTDDKVLEFIKDFAFPHRFIITSSELLIFEVRSCTEENLIQRFDLDSIASEEGEDDGRD